MSHDIKILIIAFAFLFGGYASSEVFVELIQRSRGYPNLGLTMMICVYGAFCLASPVAWRVVDRFGTKRSLILASVPYVLFVATVSKLSPLILLVLSFVLGLSASVLWNAFRTHMVKFSVTTRLGSNFGFAESMRLLSVVIFSALFGFLNRSGSFNSSVVVATVSAILGAAMLGLLKNSYFPESLTGNVKIVPQRFLGSISLVRLVSILLVVALFPGLGRGVFPVAVENFHGTAIVGYFNSFFLLSQLSANLIAGHLADRFDRRFLIFCGVNAYLVGLACLGIYLDHFYLALAGILLAGFGRAFVDVGSASYVATIAGANISRAHSMVTFMSSMGFLIPLTIGLWNSWTVTFSLTLIIALVIYSQLLFILRMKTEVLVQKVKSEFDKSGSA